MMCGPTPERSPQTLEELQNRVRARFAMIRTELIETHQLGNGLVEVGYFPSGYVAFHPITPAWSDEKMAWRDAYERSF